MNYAKQEKRAANIYFAKVEAFEQRLAKVPRFLLATNAKSWCSSCPHQEDQHTMNCAECCPIKKRLGVPVI